MLKYSPLNCAIKAIMFVGGIILAGSDSPWMPWLNGIGVIILFAMTFIPVQTRVKGELHGPP